jgi:tripartite-type tricarboxylate transporter receptor subunit TctC
MSIAARNQETTAAKYSSFVLAGLFFFCPPGLAAQVYPDRPIRLVVPYPPGGAADIMGRTLAQKLADDLGQQVIIDNRAGGGQIIGTEIVAKAAPDGYTLLQASVTHAINPGLVAKLTYDSVNDFAPVSVLAESPLVLVVHPSVPVKSTRELIAFAKARPGRLNYASSGNGSGGHLAMELFRSMTNTDMVHVPYKGAGPALTDLIAGQVQLMITSPLAAVPYVKSGRLRLLGVSSKVRSTALPDVPTVGESVPGYEATLWYAVLAPGRTPKAIIGKLNAAIQTALASPNVRDIFAKSGVDALGGSPIELSKFLAQETEKWRSVIGSAGIRRE